MRHPGPCNVGGFRAGFMQDGIKLEVVAGPTALALLDILDLILQPRLFLTCTQAPSQLLALERAVK